MSRDQTQQAGSSATQAEPGHGFWTRREKFSRQAEAAFQLEMDDIRGQRMRKAGLAAAAIYSTFAIRDYLVMPDAYPQAWAIRFLLVMPLILLCSLYAYRLRSAVLREALVAATLIAAGISIAWIAGLGGRQSDAYFTLGITLVILFGNIVVNQRFRSALITSALMMAILGLLLSQAAAIPVDARFNNGLYCITAVTISLIANLRMDRDQRRAYLARLREHERNEELSHAVELLARLSAEDALTRIANRREFDRRFAIEWSRARRDRQPLALIMIDIDLFKNYNDHYGHPAGDACLQQIAAALQAIPKRPADLVARYGGEEFVVLLPSTTVGAAATLAERMRQAVVDLQIPHATSRVAPGVTASFGVAAVTPSAMQQPGELVAAADSALYGAKEHGRNRVAAAPDAAA